MARSTKVHKIDKLQTIVTRESELVKILQHRIILGLMIVFSTALAGCQTPTSAQVGGNNKNATNSIQTPENDSPQSYLVASPDHPLSGNSISNVILQELKQDGIEARSLFVGQVKKFNNVYIIGYTYESNGQKYINVTALQYVNGKYVSTSNSMGGIVTKVESLNNLYSFTQRGDQIKTSKTTIHWDATLGLVFDKHVAAVQLVFSDHVSISQLSPQDRMFMDVTINPKFSVVQEIDFLNSNMEVIKRVKR